MAESMSVSEGSAGGSETGNGAEKSEKLSNKVKQSQKECINGQITRSAEDPQSEKTENKEENQARDQLKLFANDSSIVCLYKVTSTSIVRQTLWLIPLLFGIGFMIYQIQDRIAYYLQCPTTVEYELRTSKSLRFPTVTICPETLISRKNCEFIGLEVAETVAASISPFSATQKQSSNKSLNDMVSNAKLDYFYRTCTPQMEDQLLQCQFKRSACNRTIALDTVLTDTGLCFAFNPADANYETSQPGSVFGLRLVLYDNQSDSLAAMSLISGYRVALHDADEIPLMTLMGFRVSPGLTTSISVKFRNVSQMPSPYGDCEPDSNYTYMKCTNECMAKYLIEKCHCIPPQQIAKTSGVPCTLDDAICIMNMGQAYTSSGAARECLCPLQCNQRTYSYSISKSPFSQLFLNHTSKKHNFKGKNITVSNINREVAFLDICFSTLNYVNVQTKIGYTALGLFCDIGGTFGLILGATCLTIFEILQLMSLICIGCMERCMKRSISESPD